MPKVSIIIPVYNAETYLRECLDSVINQTFKDIEIICIDDCSTDNSIDILKEYTEKDNRIKIHVQKENQGQGIARNIALEMATGNYIMFLDPDDWLEITACEEAYNQIVKYDNDFVYFNLYFEKNNCSYVDQARLNKFQQDLGNTHIEFHKLTYPFFGYGESWYKIYNRDFLIKNNIKFSQERMAEDLPFYAQVIVNAKDASILNKPLYHYRIHQSNTILKPRHIALLSVQKQALDICRNSQYSDLFTKYYSISYIGSLLLWFKTWSKTDQTIEQDFYNRIKEAFIELDKLGIDSYIKKNIKKRVYKNYRSFINCSYRTYRLKTLPKRVIKNILSLFNKKNNLFCEVK